MGQNLHANMEGFTEPVIYVFSMYIDAKDNSILYVCIWPIVNNHGYM